MTYSCRDRKGHSLARGDEVLLVVTSDRSWAAGALGVRSRDGRRVKVDDGYYEVATIKGSRHECSRNLGID